MNYSTEQHPCPSSGPARHKSGCRGFTLIELMIVVSIIGILAAVAVPNYQWGVIKAREAVLRETLYNFNTTLDQYYADQGQYPDSLEDLKTKLYMREIPKDPFTGKTDWVYNPPPPPSSGGSGSPPSITDLPTVRSGSDKVGSNGIPYNEW